MATDHSNARRPARRMTAEQRELRARLAAHAMHARNDSRVVSGNARRAFLERFEREVDPDGTLLGRLLVPGVVANIRWGGAKRNRLFIAADTTLYSLVMGVTGPPLLPVSRQA